MKYILFFFVFVPILLYAQSTHKTELDPKTSKPMLVGLCERDVFTDTCFSSWFNSEYENYSVDTSTMKLVAKDIQTINLTIAFGTWCSDSREQIPRLLKILEYLDFPLSKIKMLAVDRNKKAGEYDIDNLKIELVPTIVLYKDDVEFGRIVETPHMSLEEDLVDMIFSSK